MSARDDILTGLRQADETFGDLTPEELVDALLAEELRALADEIASPVPPMTAGPRTEFERGVMSAVAAMRARADGGEV